MVGQQRGGHLLAVLLNPPGSTSGQRTLGAVRRAAAVLGYDGYEVANLFSEATPTVVELNGLLHEEGSWVDARQRISERLRAADGILAGWGVAGGRAHSGGSEMRVAPGSYIKPDGLDTTTSGWLGASRGIRRGGINSWLTSMVVARAERSRSDSGRYLPLCLPPRQLLLPRD